MNNTTPSGNAFKHGLRSTDALFFSRLLPEERHILDQLRLSLCEHYDPQSEIEALVVDKIAILHFRSFRFYNVEYQTVNACMNADPAGQITVSHLDPFSRYDSRINHQLKVLEQILRTLQRNR